MSAEPVARDRLLVITGTTGSGKNRLATRVAELMDAEIVSLDSMKVYRGMDIGTAKPSADLRARVPHHMLDVLDPSERMDLRRFVELALEAIADVHGRGRPVICVGGTAMYLNGLLFGVHEGPPRDEAYRRALREEIARDGLAALHDRLARLDPVSAAKIDPRDRQRIERALEIVELTGKPRGELEETWFREARFERRVAVITWPRPTLRARIEDRVDAMFDEGWVDEVSKLQEEGRLSAEASMAIGYREISSMLRGESSLEEARERTKIKTWQFARRQLTWMKKYEDARLVMRRPEDDLETLAEDLFRFWSE